ncbi:hypothetical protein ASF88_00410 [Leifsonia sp. Leaf336]|nr:hypothetical protein ASF88_00410 [Leifsonia sp. Leaf336]
MNDSENPKSKLSRRTMVGAAAWAAPAIALTAASPAQAASTPKEPAVPGVRIANADALAKAFTGPGFYAAYYGSDGSGGTRLRGMEISATVDSLPANPSANRITVNLPPQFTFSDGSTSKSFDPSGDTISVALGAQDINVAWGTAPGKYPITVDYQGVTDSVLITVLNGGTAWAWGTSTNAVNGLGSGVMVPTQWTYSSSYRANEVATFTTYNAIVGTGNTMAAYSDLYDCLVGTGIVGKPRWRRDFDVDHIVAANAGQPHGATFFWSGAGTLNAFGTNNGDMFSLGDNSPATGAGKGYDTPVAVGTKILEANPGKKIIAVHAALLRAAYILDDKTVWWSGVNTGRAMGNNDSYNGASHVATQTLTAPGTPLTDVVDIAFGDDTSLFLDGSGNLWGAGTAGSRSGAVQLPGFTALAPVTLAKPVSLPDGKKVKKIWGSQNNYIVQTTDNAVYFAGLNAYGQGGSGAVGSTFGAWRQTNVAAGKTVANVTMNNNHAFYLMTDGTLYAAGVGSTNPLGVTNPSANNITTMAKVNTNPAAKVLDFSLTDNGAFVAILQ